MNRAVIRRLIDEWVQNHGPDGISKLAVKSGVSSSMISKVRLGRVPVKPITRRALAKAIGKPEDELFPLLAQGEGQAS